jgi:hypothetical protein
MHGIVSFLDDHHDRLTRQLWEELEGRFGLRGVYVTPFPHFSYHIARGYDFAKVEAGLSEVARSAHPFSVRTSGLAVFTGPSPILYLPIVRTAALSEFHARVWQAVNPAASEAVAYYEPEGWMPHITVGFGDVSADKLAAVLREWAGRDFNWQITVDNVAAIEETASGQVASRRMDLL